MRRSPPARYGEFGTKAEQRRAGKRVERTAHGSSGQHSTSAVEPADVHRQVAEGQCGVAQGERQKGAQRGLRAEQLRQNGEVEDEHLGVDDVGQEA